MNKTGRIKKIRVVEQAQEYVNIPVFIYFDFRNDSFELCIRHLPHISDVPDFLECPLQHLGKLCFRRRNVVCCSSLLLQLLFLTFQVHELLTQFVLCDQLVCE